MFFMMYVFKVIIKKSGVNMEYVNIFENQRFKYEDRFKINNKYFFFCSFNNIFNLFDNFYFFF